MALLLGLLLLFSFLTPHQLALASLPSPTHSVSPFNRSSFPADFLFGASSSAYQYEGAAFEGGKGPSIWDTFTHKYPDKIADKSNGDIAEIFYHLYKDDVKLMKYIGLNAFRFSISWSRILPSGKLSGGVNQEGISFYNNLINELLSNGIQPFVTIFHWDPPQALEDEYNGFLSSRIVDDFVDFANICFKEFGERVKHWITLNEPYILPTFGYDLGTFAPGRCSPWRNNNCPAGNSATEPYVVAHHLLLCHAATSNLYNSNYQAVQKGEIGITLISPWFEPYTRSKLDVKATQRSFDFLFGWFLHPIVYGDYPKSMRQIVGKRLPKFTTNQSMMLKGSYDFLGINYYTARYVKNILSFNGINSSYSTDSFANLTAEKNGKPLLKTNTASPGFNIYAKGLGDLLVYTKAKYNNPTIYITENGMSDPQKVTVKEGIRDYKRTKFHHDHLKAVQEAMKLGVNVKGYLVWSFLDTFEWSSGYTVRFGVCFVDYKNGYKRHLKHSALWFKQSLRTM